MTDYSRFNILQNEAIQNLNFSRKQNEPCYNKTHIIKVFLPDNMRFQILKPFWLVYKTI